MGLTVKSAADFELAPEGTHPAIIYRVIDLGTQPTTFEGQVKHQHKVLVQWELLGDERMADGRPFSVSKRYTASLSQKAALRQHLEAIRGRPFTQDELTGFHLRNILGAPCLLQVVHAAKGDQTYVNIGALMKMPKSLPRPEPVNEQLYFDLDEPDTSVLEKLGPRLREVIESSPEWAERYSTSQYERTPPSAGTGDMADDIPF